MNTTAIEVDGRRRRRKHSAEFKASAIAACRQSGVSIASVALNRGLNANLLRRWVAAAECEGVADRAPGSPSGGLIDAPQPTPAPPAFVALSLPPPVAAPADIRVELRRGDTAITVVWPSSAASECAAWMRELLR